MSRFIQSFEIEINFDALMEVSDKNIALNYK